MRMLSGSGFQAAADKFNEERAAQRAAEEQAASDPNRRLSVSDDPDTNAARVTRAQWERYTQMYTPVEDQLINSIGQDTTREAVAGGLATIDRTDAMTDRMKQRFGVSMTAAQRGAQTAARGRTRSLATLEATNTSRDAMHDRDRAIRTGLVDVGQGLVNQATGGLTDAAGMAGQRETAHAQAMASWRANRNNNISQTMQTAGLLAVAGI